MREFAIKCKGAHVRFMLCILKIPADYVIFEFCFVFRKYCVAFANLCCVLGKFCCVWIFQFSSVLISQSKLQCKNAYNNFKLAREPRRNQKACEAGLPSHKEISKMKFP